MRSPKAVRRITGAPGGNLLHGNRQSIAVEPRHRPIGDDEIEAPRAELPQPLLAVRRDLISTRCPSQDTDIR
jgi:hypothetical protein